MRVTTDSGYTYHKFKDYFSAWDHVFTRAVELAFSPELQDPHPEDGRMAAYFSQWWEAEKEHALESRSVRSYHSTENLENLGIFQHREIGPVMLLRPFRSWPRGVFWPAGTYPSIIAREDSELVDRWNHVIEQVVGEGVAIEVQELPMFLNNLYINPRLEIDLGERGWKRFGTQGPGYCQSWGLGDTRVEVAEHRDVLPRLTRKGILNGADHDMREVRARLEKVRMDVSRYETLTRDLWGAR